MRHRTRLPYYWQSDQTWWNAVRYQARHRGVYDWTIGHVDRFVSIYDSKPELHYALLKFSGMIRDYMPPLDCHEDYPDEYTTSPWLIFPH